MKRSAVHLGEWLFQRRTAIPIPLALALLVIPAAPSKVMGLPPPETPLVDPVVLSVSSPVVERMVPPPAPPMVICRERLGVNEPVYSKVAGEALR